LFFGVCCLTPWRIEIEIHAPQLGLVTHIVEALIEIEAVLRAIIITGIVMVIAGAG